MAARTREEYLIKYEESLLSKLGGTFSALNRDVIVCFSLLLIFLLFQSRLIEEATIVGNKLKLTADQSLLLLPALICIIYLSINNSIRKIAKLVRILKSNSAEIAELNPDSRSFRTEDLDYLTEGVAGIQLQFSRLIARQLHGIDLIRLEITPPEDHSPGTKTKFTLLLPVRIYQAGRRLGFRLLGIVGLLLLMMLVYLIPLAVPAGFIYSQKLSPVFRGTDVVDVLISVNSGVFVILLAAIVYTIVSSLILSSFYFSELLEMKDNLIKVGSSRILAAFLNISKYYKEG